MKNRNKMNNNGFSLVELIIVIAIMAVLIGVLAPQYMRYVERGRASADRDNIDAIVSAFQIHAVDTEATNALEEGTITITRSGGSTLAAGQQEALTNAGIAIQALTNQSTFQSVDIVIVNSGGVITVTATETP